MSRRSLRILQVVSSTKASGAERHTCLLARLLRESGYDVALASPPKGQLTEAIKRSGATYLPITMRGLGFARAIGKLLHEHSVARFDLVHTHLTRATYLGLAFAFLARLPQVATVHVFTTDPVYRVLARRRARLIAVSGPLREKLVRAGVPAERVDLVHLGTDFLQPEFSGSGVRQEFGFDEDARIVGLIGKISREKGHLVVLEAAKIVLQQEPKARFLLVGRMEPRFRKTFQVALSRSGLEPYVVLAGNRDDVARLIDGMEIVLLPSEKETFGLAVVEAMARGRPVIATRTGGLEEVVVDKQTGLLIEQDGRQLAHAICSLLSDGEQRTRMGLRARDWVAENFTHTQMLERIEAVYERLLHPTSGHRASDGSGQGSGRLTTNG